MALTEDRMPAADEASLLAQQPVYPKERLTPPAEDWQPVYRHLTSRFAALRNARYSWWVHWGRLAEMFLPDRFVWLLTPNKSNRGSPINDQIVDGSATQSLEVCASGMWTGLTSPSRPWFNLGASVATAKLAPDAKQYLEDVKQIVLTVLAKSNFYNSMAQSFRDVPCFGTSPILCYEDGQDLVRFYVPSAGEYYLGTGKRHDVDRCYREYLYTVSQIVSEFGLDNCPSEIQMAWSNQGGELEREWIVCHAIEPNIKIAARGGPKREIQVVPEIFPWREVYWLKTVEGSQPLRKKGFNSKPFVVARWSQSGNNPYGRSPGMAALGDQRQIQQQTRNKAEFQMKGIRPPMGAPVELMNKPTSTIPGGITFFDTTNGKEFKPLFQVDPRWVPALTTDIKEVSSRIDKFFYVDVFMAITRMEGVQPRNELELTKRDLERLQQLGPVIHLFETECAGPLLVRIIDILERRGVLPPLPKSLHGIPLKIDYVSIMKLAQRSAESIAIKDVLQTAGGLSSAAKAAGVPDPIRVINLDEAMRHYADLNNFPPAALFTVDEVKEHDQIRAQEMAKAQAPQQAMAAVTAAKTLSETQLGGGGSALGALTGGGGQ